MAPIPVQHLKITLGLLRICSSTDRSHLRILPFQHKTVTLQFSLIRYSTIHHLIFQLFNYAVEGKGKQILNLGLGPEEGGLITSVEWIILNNHVFIGEGEGWNISHDGTMIVTGAKWQCKHHSLWLFRILSVSNSNLPFYQQHSVAIIIATAVAITSVIAVVIKVKNREQPSESKLVESGLG